MRKEKKKEELTLHFIPLSNQHKRKLRIPNNNPLQPNPTRTPTLDNLDLRAVEIRTNQLTPMRQGRNGSLALAFQVQDFLHILHPQRIQSPEDLILAVFRREVVDTRGALLARREWLGFLLAEEVLFLAEAVEASSIAVVVWGWRCRT